MRFKRHHLELEHGLKEIDIAPLINIIFLLLIFLMLAPGFMMQPAIKVNLPKAVTSQAVQYENIEILVSADNVTYLDGRTVTASELKKLLQQSGKRNQSILIKADKHASLDRVVEIWDICRDSGITQVNIATNQQ